MASVGPLKPYLRMAQQAGPRLAAPGARHRTLQPMPQTRLLLSSASPRRRHLVGLLGLPARVVPLDIDEAAYLLADPLIGGLNIALAKARAARPEPDEMVVAADTLVAVAGEVLGKPSTEPDAWRMLRALRGRSHTVFTGVALRDSDDRVWGAAVATTVHFRSYSDAEVEAYVASGEPFDKAGAYAVQDERFHPASEVVGCYLNVVGLPLCAVERGLETLGVSVPCPPSGGRERVPPCSFCRRGLDLTRIG